MRRELLLCTDGNGEALLLGSLLAQCAIALWVMGLNPNASAERNSQHVALCGTIILVRILSLQN